MSNLDISSCRNLVTASCLLQFINCPQDEKVDHFLQQRTETRTPSLASALKLFSKLYEYLRDREEGVIDHKYDGDEDIDDPDQETKKRKKKSVGSKNKTVHSIRLKGDPDGTKTSKLQYLVRDVIFYIGKLEPLN